MPSASPRFPPRPSIGTNETPATSPIQIGYRRVSSWTYLLSCVAVTFPMHNFWAITNPNERLMEMGNFMKNMALLGSALMLVAVPQQWPYSVETRRRFAV